MCCRASSQAHTYRFAERHEDEAPVGASTDDNSDNHSERELPSGSTNHVSQLPQLVCMLRASSNFERKLSRITPTSVRILFRSKDQVPPYLTDNLIR